MPSLWHLRHHHCQEKVQIIDVQCYLEHSQTEMVLDAVLPIALSRTEMDLDPLLHVGMHLDQFAIAEEAFK